MKRLYRSIGVISLSLIIVACGGGSSSNNNSILPENNTNPSIFTSDIQSSISQNTNSVINIANNVGVSDDSTLYISNVSLVNDEITQKSTNNTCQVISYNSLNFTVKGDDIGTCIYEYTVSDDQNRTQASAISQVAVVNDASIPATVLTPISETAQLGEVISISLDPGDNSTLSSSITLLGSGTANVDTDTNEITYTAGSKEGDTGPTRIYYNFINSDGSISIGIIDIAVSAVTLNQAPSAIDFRYGDLSLSPIDPDTLEYPYLEIEAQPLNTATPDVIDIIPYFAAGLKDAHGDLIYGCSAVPGDSNKNCITVVDEPSGVSYLMDNDGNPLQLVDVRAFNASVQVEQPTEIEGDLVSTTFTFAGLNPGIYYVTYTLSDHRGGFASGIAALKVKSPFSDVYVTDIDETFIAPLNEDQAQEANIKIDSLHTENGVDGPDGYNAPLFDYATASSYCEATGSRLPTSDELTSLYTQEGNIYTSVNASWPGGNKYWSSTQDETTRDINTVSLIDGTIETLLPSESAYVTCVLDSTANSHAILRINESGELLANRDYQLSVDYLIGGNWFPYTSPLIWESDNSEVMSIDSTGLATTSSKAGDANITATIENSNTESATSLFSVYGQINSKFYGEPIDSDSSNQYAIGDSEQIVCRGGYIVDALGTPEQGTTGGTGGTKVTINVSDIKSITVHTGKFNSDSKSTTNIGKLVFENNAGDTTSCGSNNVADSTSDTWVLEPGYKLSGFIVYADGYLHALQFSSAIE